MKRLLTGLAVALPLATTAEAKDGQVLRGLFCNTRAQLIETLDHLKSVSTLATAVAMTNQTDVVCVHAYRIKYMLIDPVIIGHREIDGQPLALYEASLIGVLVGDDPRPIAPPLRMFFVPMDEVSGAVEENGA